MISNKITKAFVLSSVVFVFLLGLQSCTKPSKTLNANHVKLALRDVGHHLLLINQDSTSIVKPVIALDNTTYQLTFQSQLAIHPDSLVSLVKRSLNKTQLPPYYLVEVLQCQDQEVAYSYQMHQDVEKGIVPCGGRQLQKGCYLINIQFTKLNTPTSSSYWYVYILLGGVLAFLAVYFKQKVKIDTSITDGSYAALGRFKFYPEQHKLITKATEISLSNKECELLSLFIAQPNQVITRDQLTKKVWEDNGVIVGRSLDTYISKLRKKLQEDPTIKLTNVHGVGYKLEVEV